MVSSISGRRRPDVLQEDVVAVLILPQRIGLEVEVHGARDAVGDHQRRRGQVVHLDVGEMRPSKLRLPESTAVTDRSLSLMAAEISSGSGPVLPMQVVQP